jgi:hypothetical protein
MDSMLQPSAKASFTSFFETRRGPSVPGSSSLKHIQVDAGDFAATQSEENGRIPGAASGIEDSAADLVGHVHKRPLRPADVPGRLAGVEALEVAFSMHALALLLSLHSPVSF